ncbi:hypothetical protein CDAR_36121 [Caerostris darwini]|uniref:Uncharacterized protein n=1 Tax=Caerostris darwini TaxID=1538125 RepID=A0AAV4VCT1_9ARAC|nr:hypothetical protein CDAR_36121 [Caerostris darwini]
MPAVPCACEWVITIRHGGRRKLAMLLTQQMESYERSCPVAPSYRTTVRQRVISVGVKAEIERPSNSICKNRLSKDFPLMCTILHFFWKIPKLYNLILLNVEFLSTVHSNFPHGRARKNYIRSGR